MKKKLIGILTALCMVISPSFALAADVTTKVDEDIELMYEQVMNMSAGLNISTFGQATCSGAVERNGPAIMLNLPSNCLKWRTIHGNPLSLGFIPALGLSE